MNEFAASPKAATTPVSENEKPGARKSSPARRMTLASVLAFLAFASATSTVQARPEYPGKVQAAFGMPCAPVCTLCHIDPNGGQNFKAPQAAVLAGIALSGQGADARKTEDVDQDMMSDYDELVAGRDPFLANADVCPPEYGACSIAPGAAPRPARNPEVGQASPDGGARRSTPLAPWFAALGTLAFLSRRVVFGRRRT